jgi:hypothetical protein
MEREPTYDELVREIKRLKAELAAGPKPRKRRKKKRKKKRKQRAQVVSGGLPGLGKYR